jgi:hypothetical protein
VLALAASLASVPWAIAQHQTGPGGPVAYTLILLVIAALFSPLRKRVQRAVDRRFNKARYDAEAIATAFSARLRQTVDLDAVRGDLVGVVHDAFQPAHIGEASGRMAERGSPCARKSWHRDRHLSRDPAPVPAR